MQNTHTRAALIRLAQAGLIAALYTVCTVLIQPAAYGTVQFRVSEALTILPVFTPAAIPGLAVGCLVSNLFGLMTGANAAGAWDLLFGSLATLLAAWLTYALRNIRLRGLPFLATWPPVLINAVVVGIEITLVYGGLPWYLHILSVAAGQFAACTVCGLLLFTALERSGAARSLFGSAAGRTHTHE